MNGRERGKKEGKKEGRIKSSAMDQILYMQFLIALKDTQGWLSPFFKYENTNNLGDEVICSRSPNQYDTESDLNSSLYSLTAVLLLLGAATRGVTECMKERGR